jgi:hypothetical protein
MTNAQANKAVHPKGISELVPALTGLKVSVMSDVTYG